MAIINITNYVRKENSKLNLGNFRDTDALVFAQLSYLDYAPFKNGTRFEFMSNKAKEAAAKSHSKDRNEELLLCVSKSLRYQHIKAAKYVDETNLLFEMQFSATTFIVNSHLIVVAFRGTDDTINGWKEDFNMVFLDEIPAQNKAVTYLKKIASKYRYAKIIVLGHSKGGNLAFYSTMKQTAKVRKRIVSIYNLDGPDFRENVTSSEEYSYLLSKSIKIVPEESIIGMILQTNSYFYIVKAEGTLFAQHNLFNWNIDSETSDLVHSNSLSKSSRQIKNSIYTWINSFSVDDRRIIVDSFFDMLLVSNCTTLSEFTENFKENIKLIYGEYRDSDSEKKKILRKTLLDLAKYLMANYFTREKNLDKKAKQIELKFKQKPGE